jgi:hypothetical protein
MMENELKFKEYIINGKTYRMNIFETAKTREDNYLIGYLLGDGGINPETHKRNARLFVSSTEKYIIDFFKNNYCPDVIMDSRIPINKTRNIVSKIESHKINFSSKFSNVFKKYGLLSKKIDRTYHNIKKDNMNCFLLGLFDADGHISWGRRKDRNRLWCNYGITHPSLKMLTKLQRFFSDELGISTYISPKPNENCYVFRTSRREDIVTILEYMYVDTPVIFNKTKYENSMRYIKEYNK